MQRELPVVELFDMFNLLCTDEFEENTEAEGYHFPSPKRQQQQDAALTLLRETFPDTHDQLNTIERLLRQAVDASTEPKAAAPVFSHMCQARPFLEVLAEYLLTHEESILASLGGVPIAKWRFVDCARYVRYGRLFAASPNVLLAHSTATAVSYGPPLNDPIPEDVDILAVLAKRNEPYVLFSVFVGLKRLGRAEAFRASALTLIEGVEIGNHHHLAKEYCDIFGPYGIPPAVLDSMAVEKILANLVAVDKLDRDAFGNFVAGVCGVAPLALVAFFEKRIVHAQLLEESGQDTDYEPVPSSFSWSSCNAIRNHPEYEASLRGLLDVMRRYPQHDYYLVSIFWHIATTDLTTFSVLDELLHTSNPDDADFLLKLLGEAPGGVALNHPIFAIHILMQCADQSEELEHAALARLVGNCFSGGGFQQVTAGTHTLGDSDSIDAIKSAATKLLANSHRDSLAFRLYTAIAKAQQPSFPAPAFSTWLGKPEDFEED